MSAALRLPNPGLTGSDRAAPAPRPLEPRMAAAVAAHGARGTRATAEAEAGWLSARRAAAREVLELCGLPSRSLEAWRFTDLRGVLDPAFAEAPDAATLPALPALASTGPRVVLSNGRYDAAVSDLTRVPAGVRVTPLAAALAPGSVAEARLFKLVPPDLDGFAAVSALAFTDGVVIEVADGVEVAAPLHLVLRAASGRPAGVETRLLIVLGANARLTLIEHHHSVGPLLLGRSAEITLGAGAQLGVVTDDGHGPATYALARTGVVCGRDAQASFGLLATGGRLSRHEMAVRLDAPGASARIAGAALIADDSLVDITSTFDHAAPHTTSDEVVKLALAGRSRGVFQGRIRVRPNAQKIAGYQISRALLLSPDALADLKPELEIFADDVKCTHGATVGAIDADQMFYLRARGLDAATARRLLIEAFVAEVLEAVADETVRAALADRIAASAGALP